MAGLCYAPKLLALGVAFAHLASAAEMVEPAACPLGQLCESGDDEVALIQRRPVVTLASSALGTTTTTACSVGDHVMCPHSGVMCAGNQCCPGAGPGGLTFPCPSSDASFAGCQDNSHRYTCLEETTSTPTTSSSPSTSESTSITSSTTASNSTATATTTEHMVPKECEVGEQVRCPFSDTMCAGNQCCPGIGVNGSTTPCPSADTTFDGCEDNSQIYSCVLAQHYMREKESTVESITGSTSSSAAATVATTTISSVPAATADKEPEPDVQGVVPVMTPTADAEQEVPPPSKQIEDPAEAPRARALEPLEVPPLFVPADAPAEVPRQVGGVARLAVPPPPVVGAASATAATPREEAGPLPVVPPPRPVVGLPQQKAEAIPIIGEPWTGGHSSSGDHASPGGDDPMAANPMVWGNDDEAHSLRPVAGPIIGTPWTARDAENGGQAAHGNSIGDQTVEGPAIVSPGGLKVRDEIAGGGGQHITPIYPSPGSDQQVVHGVHGRGGVVIN